MTTFFEFLINITHSVFSDNKEIMSQLYSNNNDDNSMQNSKEIFIHTSLILIAIDKIILSNIALYELLKL